MTGNKSNRNFMGVDYNRPGGMRRAVYGAKDLARSHA